MNRKPYKKEERFTQNKDMRIADMNELYATDPVFLLAEKDAIDVDKF